MSPIHHQHPDTAHPRAHGHGRSMTSHYRRLLVMAVLSFVAMYVLMYARVIIELGVMRALYQTAS